MPNLLNGEMVNIKFANEQLKGYQEMIGGGLVISVGMNRALFGRYVQFEKRKGRSPQLIPLEEFPFRVFVPFIVNTNSRLGEGMVQRGTRCLAFFSVPRMISLT